MFGWQARPVLPVEHWLSDGESLSFGKRAAEVIHTPGHTPGSCCFRVAAATTTAPRAALAGDTLFRARSAAPICPAATTPTIERSIQRAASTRSTPTPRVIPGHGPRTTVGDEARHNPFVQGALMIRYPERIRRARLPTPVEPARRLSSKLGVELLVKRDDLTGASLSGNKIRKLEFLLAEAAAEGADTVITCGGEQSNHCRATAIAAAELGLRSYLLLRTENPKEPPAAEANILLDRLVGADIRWVSRDEYKRRAQLFVEVQGQLLAQRRKAYVIPEGGSNALGAWGYVGCVEELAQELRRRAADARLRRRLGRHRRRAHPRHQAARPAVARRRHQRVRRQRLLRRRHRRDRRGGDQAVAAAGRASTAARSRSVDGYVGVGYAKSRPEELQTIRDVARAEGLILDPVYTGKAFHGMTQELARDRARFGERICFIHTGGIFGLFPKATELEPLL